MIIRTFSFLRIGSDYCCISDIQFLSKCNGAAWLLLRLFYVLFCWLAFHSANSIWPSLLLKNSNMSGYKASANVSNASSDMPEINPDGFFFSATEFVLFSFLFKGESLKWKYQSHIYSISLFYFCQINQDTFNNTISYNSKSAFVMHKMQEPGYRSNYTYPSITALSIPCVSTVSKALFFYFSVFVLLFL